MSHRLQVTLDDDLYDALQVEARLTGASLAELVRRSVSERLGVRGVADRLAILERTAGAWSDERSGVEFQKEQRGGLQDRPLASRVPATTRSGRRRVS